MDVGYGVVDVWDRSYFNLSERMLELIWEEIIA
ncbi:hypothetical protein N836_09505 [Leptolyngbya sp. Heron Island J]|nr:hypothetical protein N836_09505 [Leptolyngbya sp. Heron Island J]